MSEKIIVKLRRDNISVSSCKEGVYLTFDAENARPIICKYSEVITIFTLGPVLHSFLEKAKISTGLLHWESANPFVKLRSRAVKDYVLILNEIRKIAIEDDLKAIVISLDDRAFPDFLLKKGEDEKFYLEVMKIAKDLNLIIFVLWYTFPENECDWGDKLIWIETPIGCYKTETADFF